VISWSIATTTRFGRRRLRSENLRAALGGRSRIERDLDWRPVLAFECCAELLHDAGLADSFHVMASQLNIFKVQHRAGRVVDQTQAAIDVHDEHALDHARQDCRHARAVGGQPGHLAAQLLD
jgi:hypothetical protein